MLTSKGSLYLITLTSTILLKKRPKLSSRFFSKKSNTLTKCMKSTNILMIKLVFVFMFLLITTPKTDFIWETSTQSFNKSTKITMLCTLTMLRQTEQEIMPKCTWKKMEFQLKNMWLSTMKRTKAIAQMFTMQETITAKREKSWYFWMAMTLWLEDKCSHCWTQFIKNKKLL